jgi:hypothetical protein
VLVIFGEEPTDEVLAAFADQHGLRLERRSDPVSRYYLFKILDAATPEEKTRDVLTDPLIVHATPNWLVDPS